MSDEKKFGIVGWSLILCFFLLPLEGLGLLKMSMTAGGLTAAKLAIMLSLMIWFVQVIFTRDFFPVYSFYSNFTSMALVAGLVVGMASIVTTRHHPLFTMTFIQTTSLILLYFLMINVIKAKERLFKWVFAAMLLSSFLNSLGGVYEMATGDMILKGRRGNPLTPAVLSTQRTLNVTESGKKRIASFSGDTGLHGVHWAMYGSLFLCIPFLFKGFWKKTAVWVATIITVVNCIATGTRTGLAGLAVGGLVFFVFAKIRYRFLIGALALVVSLVVAVAFKSPLERILGKGQKAQISVDWRGAQSKVALLMIRDHPILGVGMGNYVGLYYLYNRTVPTAPKTAFIMHNGFLEIWSEQGILGLITFISVFVSVFVVLINIYRHPANRYVEIVSLGLLSALAAHVMTIFGYPMLNDEHGFFLMGFSISLKAVNDHLRNRLPAVATS